MVSQFKIRCEIDPISQAAARPRSQALTKVLTKLILPNSNKSYINIIGPQEPCRWQIRSRWLKKSIIAA
jgi:hypothetical protein